jgi:hypothetical protein
MNEDFSDPWPRLVVIGVIGAVLSALFMADCSECEQRGGAYVEGYWKMECVEVKR